MKIKFSAVILLVSLCSYSFAGDVALVYENEAAVKEGKFLMAPATTEGAVVSAKFAMTNNTSILVGYPNDKLKKGILLRLDNKLDAAVIQPGEVLANEDLQKAYGEIASALAGFIPGGTSAVSITSPMVVASTEPYVVRVNGLPVGPDPIELEVKSGRSEIELEILRPAAAPIWRVDLKMNAEPKLSFWKKNKEKKSLADIPRPEFSYYYQAMFQPLSLGRSFSVPVEIHFIKEEKYTLNLKLESKVGNYETKIPVIFKSKSK